MNIAILYPAIEPDATLEDQDTLIQVQAIADTLRHLGHEPVPMPCGLDLAALREALLTLRPPMVFNLAESLDGSDALQYVPPALLDTLGIPYTGNSTEAIFRTTHKLLAKQLLDLAGLPTPAWLGTPGGLSRVDRVAREKPRHCVTGIPVAYQEQGSPTPPSTSPGGRGTEHPRAWNGNPPDAVQGLFGCSANNPATKEQLEPPCILKAVWEHASRGIDDRNVLMEGDAALVRERLREFTARMGRPCFAEQFIEGREFNLAMLDGPDGPQVLPPGEIDFSTFPPGKPRIVGHRAKWHADSFEYDNTPRYFHFPPEDRPLLDRLRQLALDCWRLFSLRGYARVDFRVDRQGQPWILEVNTNPCLSPDAGIAAALAEAGVPYTAAIQRILEASKAESK